MSNTCRHASVQANGVLSAPPMRPSDSVLIFGATGYTAGLILQAAQRVGLAPIVSARDPRRLAEVAASFELEARPASLEDLTTLKRALAGVQVVLNAAGPFTATVQPLVTACLEMGIHYLDISGEVKALELAAEHHAAAYRAGTMLLPGVGFDVVPSDCLCAHVLRRAPDAVRLRIAVSGLELLSPGSIRSLMADFGQPTLVRHRGALREISPGSLMRTFDFGTGQRACLAVSWGDLVTAHYSTGIADIETFFEATPAILTVTQMNRALGFFYSLPWVRQSLERQARLFRLAPSAAERQSRRARIVVEAEDAAGRVAASVLTTPEAYTLTAETAITITKRVLRGDVEPGFQTPARLFGPDFILGFAGVSRMDLETKT